MKRLATAALILDLTAQVPANATEWGFVTISTANSIYYIDRDSIRKTSDYGGQIVSAWFKIDESKNAKVRHRETKILYHFRCATSEMKSVQWIDYAADGSVVNSSQSNAYSSFRVAVPDSVGYSMLEVACNPEPDAM